jgi:hypothetical protein
VSRAGIHSQIFVILVLVLNSCYSQSSLAIGFLCCYSFLTPQAFFLGEGGLFMIRFVYCSAADVLCFSLCEINIVIFLCLYICCSAVTNDPGLSTHTLYFGFYYVMLCHTMHKKIKYVLNLNVSHKNNSKNHIPPMVL